MYHFISLTQAAVPTFLSFSLSLRPCLPQSLLFFKASPFVTDNSHYSCPSSAGVSVNIFLVFIFLSLHIITHAFGGEQSNAFAVSLWLHKQRKIGLSELSTCLHLCKTIPRSSSFSDVCTDINPARALAVWLKFKRLNKPLQGFFFTPSVQLGSNIPHSVCRPKT